MTNVKPVSLIRPEILSSRRITLQQFRADQNVFTRYFISVTIREKLAILSKLDKSILPELKRAVGSFVGVENTEFSTLAIDGLFRNSDSITQRVAAAIEYALANGHADEISQEDFYHGHIVIRDYLIGHYAGITSPEQFLRKLKEGKCALLYHTHELGKKFTSPEDYHRRNIVQDETGSFSHPHKLTPSARFSPTVLAPDIGAYEYGQIYFELDNKGKHLFVHNGQRHRFSAYVVLNEHLAETISGRARAAPFIPPIHLRRALG